MTVKLPSADDFSRPTPTAARHVSSYAVSPSGGTEMGKAMSEFGKMVLQETERLDDIKAEDAVNKAKLRAMNLANGEDGYSTKKGEDVVNQTTHKNYTDRFKKAMDQVESSLGNPNQINKFRRRIAPLNQSYQSSLVGHIAKETADYADLTDASSLKIEASNAAANALNPQAVADARERSLYTINSTIKRKGMDGNTKEAKLNREAFKLTELTKFHTGVINSMLVNNPEIAKEYFKNNSKEIDGNKHDDIRRLLDDGTVLGIAQKVADEVMSENLDIGKSLILGRKKAKTPKEREAIDAQIHKQHTEKKLVVNDYIKEAKVHLQSNPSLSSFPQEKRDAMGVDNILLLEKLARENSDPVTNESDLHAFNIKLRKALRGDKASIDFITYVDMEDMYSEVLSRSDFRKAAAAQNAFLVNDAKAKATAAKNNEEVLGNKAASDGALMPSSTRDEILRELSKKSVVPDAGFMMFDKELDIEDIDSVYLKEITAELRKYRKAVTADNILEEYAARFRAGIYDD